MTTYNNQLNRMGGNVAADIDQGKHFGSIVASAKRISAQPTVLTNNNGSISMLSAAASLAGLMASRQDQHATADAMNPGKGNDAASPTQRPSPYS